MIEEIRDYVGAVCALLSIDPPRIKEAEQLGTGTTLAETSADGRTIRIKSGALSMDLCFALAHELRHVWQIRTDEAKWLDGYQPSSRLDLAAYNLQPAELDANAFAAIIMINSFHRRPIFRALPEDVVKKTYARAEEIARELNNSQED